MVLRRHGTQTQSVWYADTKVLISVPVSLCVGCVLLVLWALSITVGVSLCFIGLALMWYDVYVVVVGRGALWEHPKPWL